jgi:hypothetical protein
MNRRLGTAVALLACVASAPIRAAASQPAICEDEVSALTSKTDLPRGIGARVDRSVRQAAVLARFHRSSESLGKIDALVTFLDGAGGAPLQDTTRTDLTTSLRALRSCVTATPPAALATLTIRVFNEDDTRKDGRGTSAGAGVYVDVDGIPVGRSGPRGTLRVNVPSGAIEIHATQYPSSWGAGTVSLTPGGAGTVSIVLAGDKEPSEESDLVLEEAPDGILPITAESVTLKFLQDDSGVNIEHIDDMELSDASGESGDSIEELFMVAGGAIHAADVQAVYQQIAQHSRIGRPLSLNVGAIDTEGRRHYGSVRFQLGQFHLAVTLAAPPSNPGLSVANIPVRISVIGSDTVITRISDANGHFEIDSLPDATVAFEAHTTSSNVHYYSDAAVTLCANRSITVRMLNVKDLVAGVRAMTLEPGTPACPRVPRR